jgi:zinc transport system permease protein
MAVTASAIAMLTVAMGLAMSWYTDTPAGPSIVVCAALLFILSLLFRQKG